MRAFCAAIAMLIVTATAKLQPENTHWALTWSDEFNGANGGSPDAAKWVFDVGGRGWGNKELESYTPRAVNAHLLDGNLVISALKEDYTGPDGIARQYTSARLKTLGRFTQTYGRFEARMRLPSGKGMWPAFWMLGDDIKTADWPRAGEIDIMENIGAPDVVYSTIHGPGYSGAKGPSTKFPLPAAEAVNNGFHVYALEWAPNSLKFFFDDKLIVERTPKDLPEGTTWVYDHPFFILLNLAVGGAWPGYPDDTTTFPQTLLVDYVRVYRAR